MGLRRKKRSVKRQIELHAIKNRDAIAEMQKIKAVGGFQSFMPYDCINWKWETDKPHILYAIDRYGWAFWNIARNVMPNLQRYENYEVPFLSVAEGGDCDVAICFWWQSILRLKDKIKAGKWLMGLYDHFTWKENNATWKPANSTFLEALKVCDGIFVSNEMLMKEVSELTDKPIYLCEDGVDTKLFTVQDRNPDRIFKVGWTGNSLSGNGAIKGLDVIKAACNKVTKAKIATMFLDRKGFDTKDFIPHDEMPNAFYKAIDAYLCASVAEGTPNPLLESLACGVPVITTRVGLVDKFARCPGVIVAKRTPEAFARAIERMAKRDRVEIAKACRKAVEPFDWKIKSENFARMIEDQLAR